MGSNWLDKATDDELRAELKVVDDSDATVSNWEAQFIESVLFKKSLPMSAKQRDSAIKIIRKYTE